MLKKEAWFTGAFTLIAVWVSYVAGSGVAAWGCGFVGIVILIVMLAKSGEVEGESKPTINDALRAAVKVTKSQGPDVKTRFSYDKYDATIDVTNMGSVADVWAPMKIEGMMKRGSGDVFGRWTHTESVKIRIAKGQTCRLRIAHFDVNWQSFFGQWVVYRTTENGATEDRAMSSVLLGNPDTQTPDIHIFVDVVSDPDNISGIKKHHIVLHSRDAEET